MICKKYQIDNNVLGKVTSSKGSMFALSGIMNEEYNPDVRNEIARTPQKLSWMTKKYRNIKKNSFYERVLMTNE